MDTAQHVLISNTSKNRDIGEPLRTAQMLGDREHATFAATVVREDCGRAGNNADG
jgi:hypothetical protein